MLRLERSGQGKPIPYFRQEESSALLDSAGFYKRVCEALGLEPGRGTKAQIAKMLDITKSAAGSWEHGEMPGRDSLKNVVRISELTNTSLHWLLTGEGPKLIQGRERQLSEPISVISPEVRKAIRKEVIEVLGMLLLSDRDRAFANSLVDDVLRAVQKKVQK